MRSHAGDRAGSAGALTRWRPGNRPTVLRVLVSAGFAARVPLCRGGRSGKDPEGALDYERDSHGRRTGRPGEVGVIGGEGC